MSCGDPHDADCSEVLNDVYEYLHTELDEQRLTQIRQHLDACPACLQEFGLERLVRDLVHRACHCTPAPDALRSTILTRIEVIRQESQRA
jgi:anti-sigma factor (TIGR02949 family)